MQIYENSSEKRNLCKRIISDFLGFLKYKVDNDQLALEEERAIVSFIEENLPLHGTADDFAGYFRQPASNVRNVISRRMLSKPKRRVVYSFLDFRRIIPDKWTR